MSQLTYRDGLIYPYEGTPLNLIDVTNAESIDALLTTEWFIAVVDATGTAAQGAVNLTANNGTATGTTGAVDGNATGAQGAVTLTGNNGTASAGTSSTATGSQGAVTLSGNTGTASGTATATGSQGAVSLAPNTGAANTSGTALGSQGIVNLAPNAGTATGTSTANGDATGGQGAINITGANGSGSGDPVESTGTGGGLVKSAKPIKREDYRKQIQEIIDRVTETVEIDLPDEEIQEIKAEAERNFAQEAFQDALALQMALNNVEMRLYLLADDLEDDEFLLLS